MTDTLIDQLARAAFDVAFAGYGPTKRLIFGGDLSFDEVKAGIAEGRIVAGALEREYAMARAMLAAIDQAGSAIVPKKLTPAMREQIVDWMSGGDATGDPDMAWSEALKAAPSPDP